MSDSSSSPRKRKRSWLASAPEVAAEFDPVEYLLARPELRFILGITGPPGAGKSTYAAWLGEQLGPNAIVVPMDGFHMSNTALDAAGLRSRKGAPDTYDVA